MPTHIIKYIKMCKLFCHTSFTQIKGKNMELVCILMKCFDSCFKQRRIIIF